MFHRAKNDTVQSESAGTTDAADKGGQNAQNNTKTISQSSLSHSNQEKGKKTMNTPQNTATATNQEGEQAKAQEQQGQNNQQRVDIPGNNFQRSNGQQPASRPAYPGTYTGAGSSSYSPAASTDDSRRLTIGKGITMSGEIESCDHLVVAGTVEATLKGASVLEISESGSFYGTVEIEEAHIAGNFEGDITVSGRLTVQSTGTITGTITYKELAMEVGATLDGTVSPIGSERKATSKPAPSKSKKASVDTSAELPFSGGKANAA